MNPINAKNASNATNAKNALWLWIPPLVLFIYLYIPSFINIYKSWFSFRGSHGSLVLFISLYLVWRKRSQIAVLPSHPSIVWGAPFILLGCLILIIGRLTYTQLIQDVSLVFALYGLIGLIGGHSYQKALLVPIAYLFFMFPLFDGLLNEASIYFQYIGAHIASILLGLSGMPVLLNDQFIQLPHISLEVAKACNGINHMIALVALAVPLAYLDQVGWIRRIALIGFAFLLGVFLNGLRVAAIGFWSKFGSGGSLHGPYDIFYVSLILYLGIAILLLFSKGLKKIGVPKEKPVAKDISVEKINGAGNKFKTNPPAIAVIGGSVILILTTGFLVFFKPQPVLLKNPLHSFPLQIGDWKGQEMEAREGLLKEVVTGDSLDQVYRDRNNREIKLSIRYFQIQSPDQKIVSHRTASLHHDVRTISLPATPGSISINASLQRLPGRRAVVYSWYDINGKILTSPYKAKWESLKEAFLKRKTNGAIIAITKEGVSNNESTIPDGSEMDFINKIISLSHDFF